MKKDLLTNLQKAKKAHDVLAFIGASRGRDSIYWTVEELKCRRIKRKVRKLIQQHNLIDLHVQSTLEEVYGLEYHIELDIKKPQLCQ